MTEDEVQQAEEREAVKAIFESDDQFSVISETCFQYKYGEDGSSRSFLLQVSWPPDYPTSSSAICNLDVFYNKHLLRDVKESVASAIAGETETLQGMPMTYSIFEFAREHHEEWLQRQPEIAKTVTDDNEEDTGDALTAEPGVSEPKQQTMSKAQKRKMWDRGEGLGARERGYNWVDIVKHLSQTGGQRAD